jgi:anti-sigma factor RsiW
MNCRHLLDNLEAYVRNELDAESEKQVAAHLAICNNCRSRHEAIFVIHIALKDLPTHRARGDFNAQALEKLAHLQAAQSTVQRVENIAHARLSPWRRLVLWLDSLVPRGLLRYSSPAMAGAALGLILALAIILTPRGQQTIEMVRQAGEVSWWKQLSSADWTNVESQAEPQATPFATPLSDSSRHQDD